MSRAAERKYNDGMLTHMNVHKLQIKHLVTGNTEFSLSVFSLSRRCFSSGNVGPQFATLTDIELTLIICTMLSRL